MADFGINDDEFIKNLGKRLPRGSSALFFLGKRSTHVQATRPQDLLVQEAGG